jgi:hypothetical protein
MTMIKDGQYERQMQTPFKVDSWLNGKLDVIIFDEAWSMYDEWWDFLSGVNFKYRCFDGAKPWIADQKVAEPRGGTVIVSRHPIEHCQFQRYYTGNPLFLKVLIPDCRGMDCMVSKGMLFARVKKGSKYYNIFGTHMNANYEHMEDKQSYGQYHDVRVVQSRTAAAFMAKMKSDGLVKDGEPMLFGGDLNTDWLDIHHKAETQTILSHMGITPVIPSPLKCTYCLAVENDLVGIDYPALKRGEYIDYLGYHASGQAPSSSSAQIMDMNMPTVLDSSTSLHICKKVYELKTPVLNVGTPGYAYHNDPNCAQTAYVRQLSDHAPVVATFTFTADQPSCIDPNKQMVQTPDGVKLLKDVVEGLPGAKVMVVPFPDTLVSKVATGMRQFLGLNFGFAVEAKGLVLLNDEVVGDDWDGDGGWKVTMANGDTLYLAAAHELMERKDGNFHLTEVKNLKSGDEIVTSSNDTQVEAIEQYTLQRKVTVITEPMGFLLSEKGVLLPPMDEPLPGDDKFVNLDDIISLAHAWGPTIEAIHKDHPCLFDHLATNRDEIGHAVIVQFFEDFLKEHPHESQGVLSQPQDFLEHIHSHHETFSAHALKFCAKDTSV